MSNRPPQDPYQPNPTGSGNSGTYPGSHYPQDPYHPNPSGSGNSRTHPGFHYPQDPYHPNPSGSGNSAYPGSHYTQDTYYQPDESHGSIPYRAGFDDLNSVTFPGSRSLQPVQGGNPPSATRSVSTTWATAIGEAQFSGSHEAIPNLESPPSAQYNIPPYASTQSQLYPSAQEQAYFPPNFPPGGASPNRGSGLDRTFLSHPQQPALYDTAPPAQTQYRGSPNRSSQQDYPERTPQQQYSRSRSTNATSLGQRPAGSGRSYSRRVEVVRSHTITSESVTYEGVNNANVGGLYQSGDYPEAGYKSLGSQSIENPGSVAGGGGGSGGSATVHVHIHDSKSKGGSGDDGHDSNDQEVCEGTGIEGNNSPQRIQRGSYTQTRSNPARAGSVPSPRK